MFSVIKGVAPRDQLEAMLAAQMAAVHVNAMTIAKELKESQTSAERESTERSLNKLSRTFVSQLKLGLYTREAIAGRKALRNLLSQSRKLMMRLITSREGSQDPEPDG
jgi:hypothetical protein